MQFAVFFEDNDDNLQMRSRYMADHLAFLERHRDEVLAAGPLTDSATGHPAGGLWLVTADDAAAVRRLIEEDPFWPTGLRKSVSVLAWKQVFAEGKRCL